MVTNVTVDFVTIKEAMDAGDFDLEQFLPFRLNRAAEFIALRFAAAYKAEYGLTRPEWRTLAALGSSGRMTATEVGVHSTMHKTKVSRAVFALEERRWLKRTQDEDDRRVEHLELTAAGQQSLSRTDETGARLFGGTGVAAGQGRPAGAFVRAGRRRKPSWPSARG